MDKYNTSVLVDNRSTEELTDLVRVYQSIYLTLEDFEDSTKMVAEVLAEVQEILAGEKDNASNVMQELVNVCNREISAAFE